MEDKKLKTESARPQASKDDQNNAMQIIASAVLTPSTRLKEEKVEVLPAAVRDCNHSGIYHIDNNAMRIEFCAQCGLVKLLERTRQFTVVRQRMDDTTEIVLNPGNQ